MAKYERVTTLDGKRAADRTQFNEAFHDILRYKGSSDLCEIMFQIVAKYNQLVFMTGRVISEANSLTVDIKALSNDLLDEENKD